MKSSTKYRIFLFLCLTLALFVGYAGSQLQINNSETEKKPVVTKQTQADTNRFWLKEQNGMVVIYRADKVTLFDRTAIQIEQLPIQLQRKIRQGYFLKDNQSLYDFLENYSS